MTRRVLEALDTPAITVGVALWVLLAGIALIVAIVHGPDDLQDCVDHGGSYVHHYDSTSSTPDGWVEDWSCTVPKR